MIAGRLEEVMGRVTAVLARQLWIPTTRAARPRST